MKIQRGFTLIELVVVIVILGILAATAIPKFVDLSSDAGNAAAQGVAAGLASASSLNYAKWKASGTSSTAVGTAGNTSCPTVATNLLAGGYDATKFTITGTLGCTAASPVDSTNCSVKSTASNTTAVSATITCTL